jgi:hypothetical protein
MSTAIRPIAGALMVFMGLSGAPLLAQPFRTQTVPPRSPSLEAQQSFQARVDEQAQLLARDGHFPRLPERNRRALVEFVVGNVLFATIHQLGHALLSDMSLPTLGGAEQAADDFAVLTALQLGEKNFSDRILIEAGKAAFTRSRREKHAQDLSGYYDRHGFTERRAYRIACLMVGADPVRFKALGEETTFPKTLRRGCGWEHDRASRSWQTVLSPHRPASDRPKTRIEVFYRAAPGKLDVYAQVFRNLGFLEAIAEFATDRFAWRDPISIEMRSCGGADATWTVATRTLNVCYEMAQDFAERYRDVGRDP